MPVRLLLVVRRDFERELRRALLRTVRFRGLLRVEVRFFVRRTFVPLVRFATV